MIGWEETVDDSERRLTSLISQLVNSGGLVAFDQLSSRVAGYRFADDAPALIAEDVSRLTQYGLSVTLHADRGEVELEPRSWELRRLKLAPLETELLDRALELAEPHDEALTAAVEALRATEPADTSDVTVSLAAHTHAPGWPDVFSRLHRLGNMMDRGVLAGFGYPGHDGEMVEHEFAVYGLGEYRGVWYAAGTERDSDTIRAFALAQMRGPVQDASGEGAYSIPPGFHISAYLALGWRLGPDPEPMSVRFDPSLAPFISQVLGDLPFARTPEGAIELTVDVGDLDGFVSWVLSFGTHARIISPERAVRRAVQILRTLVERHG